MTGVPVERGGQCTTRPLAARYNARVSSQRAAMPHAPSFEYLRDQIVGVDSTFTTPFGERLMVYCDYTASGRCLLFVENYLQSLQRTYANTHTEDDTTGRNMTRLLHEAEEAIKGALNAGKSSAIIAVGTGAT